MTGRRRDAARHASRRIRAAAATAALLFVGLPAHALAHKIGGTVTSPLPLVAYMAGAAVAVGLSFAFLALTDTGPSDAEGPPRVRVVPRWLRVALQVTGLVAWLWIATQALIGGSTDADVASLFLWVYGWIGVAIVSALVGPVWTWLDPFTTLFDIATWVGRRLGASGTTASVAAPEFPARLRGWPAVAGFAFFIWLELVFYLMGGRTLGLVFISYTLVTLAAMAYFGRDAWRAHGETFSVWFRLLGRLAPLVIDRPPDETRVRHRGFGHGLTEGPWAISLLVLVALAAGAILFDGFSQTPDYIRIFGFTGTIDGTVILTGFMLILLAVVLGVARVVGIPAMTAGLIPVACGYLIAHYLTTLLVDGQRIVVALSDPFQQGWDLFGTAFYEPGPLPTSLVWGIQLGAVVGGHIVGAWAGHAVAKAHGAAQRSRQVPLALVMVALTTLTLWSLGQNLVFVDRDSVGDDRVRPSESSFVQRSLDRADRRVGARIVVLEAGHAS